ncbi:hypothetical protein RJ639_006293 [Escallonia herrerae]|uniref:Uncharacterized protein n=1 Tax=Escallonia herrerae TaxID=1293975 RepID=A0AA88VW41_9ASTE|nr:hypothetical protein RJ639_006293 [Escallonia herrerae]
MDSLHLTVIGVFASLMFLYHAFVGRTDNTKCSNSSTEAPEQLVVGINFSTGRLVQWLISMGRPSTSDLVVVVLLWLIVGKWQENASLLMTRLLLPVLLQ